MDDELQEKLQLFERAVKDLQQVSRNALGFQSAIEHHGITFNVSRRYVVADLSPLAYFHLVEPIEETPQAAVSRLYERIYPLLSCRHQWTELRRESDAHIRSLSTLKFKGFAGPRKCKVCTAFALGAALPAIGRDSLWKF